MRFGTTKGKIRVKKAIFGVIWGSLDLVWDLPLLNKKKQKDQMTILFLEVREYLVLERRRRMAGGTKARLVGHSTWARAVCF